MSLVAALLAVVPVWGGVRIRMEETELKTGSVNQREVLLDTERMRINPTGGGNPSAILFLTDNGRNRIVLLDTARNEYRELDQQTLSQLSGMMAQMQKQLQNLPPEQRARIEQMMRGRMGQAGAGAGASAVRTTYTAKGNASVNGFACTKYEGMRGTEKVAELCAAKPADLHFNAADFQALEKLREFAASFLSGVANSPFSNGRLEYFTQAGFEGYPVEYTAFAGGEAVSKTQVKSIERANFTDADFSLGDARKAPMMPGAR
ncbi:MAG TPA: hypothetical protein VKV17_03235 [Bryobacteraceae bacterium]|nr:hypothetical protein [Bryobacteraceae bacterium]